MKSLVVFYSRTGNSKKVASEIAKCLIADIEEITEPKSRTGIIGWIISGKDATCKKVTKINKINKVIENYDLVIVGTPVWAWNISSPIRSFLMEYGIKMKKIAFFATMGGDGDKRTFMEMEKLCQKKPICTLTILDKQIKNDQFKDVIVKFVDNLSKDAN